MQNSSRRRCLVAGAALAAGVFALPLHAQFKASAWPRARAVPPLSGVDLQGRAWDLAALRGRVVLLNFWATWCAPCKEEMPTLQTLAELEGERLAVLAINVREAAPRVKRYLQATGLQLPVLLDPKGETTRAWGVSVFPTTVLMDTKGQPRQIVLGAVDWSGAQAADWIQAARG